MTNRTKNIITAVAAVVLLGIGVVFTVNPELKLSETIRGLVNLPKSIFSYVYSPDAVEQQTEDEAAVAEALAEQTEEEAINANLNPNETPMVFFDDTDRQPEEGNEDNNQEEEPQAPPGKTPIVAGINELPVDELE